MPKQFKLNFGQKRWAAVIVLALILSLAAWCQAVYTSPKNVFWGMIDNSLSTTGVERKIIQKNSSGTLEQTTLLRFGSNNTARGLVSLSQKDGPAETIIRTESIGTPTTDYNRYLSIKTGQKNINGQPLDFGPVIGIWGRSVESEGQVPQFMSQTAFSLVPFANLKPKQRQQIISVMHSKKVYTVDFNQVKIKKENGRQVYIYTVNLDPFAYIKTLQELVKITGLAPIKGLNAEAYSSSRPIKLTLFIAKNSRQLVKIEYNGNSQVETYSGYGLMANITPPAKAIPLSQLQGQVQNIH